MDVALKWAQRCLMLPKLGEKVAKWKLIGEHHVTYGIGAACISSVGLSLSRTCKVR
jgi:hypothetical protein